jgi:hypothetical protein
MSIKYIGRPTSSIARPPKFAQIGIFGLKICHLATLVNNKKGNLLLVSSLVRPVHLDQLDPCQDQQDTDQLQALLESI